MERFDDRPRLRLLLAGDAMLGRGVDCEIARLGPSYPLEDLRSITGEADLFFVNLECAISARERRWSGPPKVFYFRACPRAAETLCDAGVDFASLANNHALDADYDGLRDTIDILDEHGIRWAGAGPDMGVAGRPAVWTAGGLRLGVLAYCNHQRDFAAELNRPGIRYVDAFAPETPDILARDVADLRATADCVIVSVHWQPNWAPRVDDLYRRLARRMVDAGARIIWGHSPHHFQGVEWVDGAVVLYSAGDFLNDYSIDPVFRNDRQLLFEIVLAETQVEQVRAYPIELEYAHTHPATADAWDWIARRFEDMCRELGSRVERQQEWLVLVSGEW